MGSCNHSVAGSPIPPANNAPNGIDLEVLKRNAQIHMQQNLARIAVEGSNTGGKATQRSKEANGNHRGVKREAVPDNGARHHHQNTKRSRLAVSATDDTKLDGGQQAYDPEHEQIPRQRRADDIQEDEAYQSVTQMVQQVQANRVSRLARDAKDCLRNLDAAEGIGVIAWLIDGMLTHRTDEKCKETITDWVTDLGTFIKRRTQL